jgi:hypothetical protein
MADPRPTNREDKQKYDLPGMQDPATLPKDKALKRSEKSVTLRRKDVKPDKIRRLI